MKRLKAFFGWLRSCISPVYVTMLVAAFVLWYITKLGDNYTTDHQVTVIVDGNRFDVGCTIRGKGTDLIGYTLTSRNSEFDIPIAELSFEQDVVNDEGIVMRHISGVSLQQALASRMNDVDVVAVGITPSFEVGRIHAEEEFE